MKPHSSSDRTTLNRRAFLAATGATVVSAPLASLRTTAAPAGGDAVAIGLIGCGGRGRWIAKLFQKHGGYRVVAAADYFQDRLDAVGQECSIPGGMRFAGLSGYRRLLEQKLDAVIIKSPPYFHPEQAAAAVEAGLHVYLAKPIAVDVPGCLSVEASGRRATERQRCFLVDFQTRANPAYQEVVQRVHRGQIGRIVSAEATYHCGNTFDAVNEVLKKDPHNPEARLRAWGLDRVLSGDVITEQNIHALDVAAWFLDAHPLKALGTGGHARGFAGTCWDHFAVIFHYPKDVLVSFNSKQFGHGYDDILCRVYGTEGTADTHYAGKVTLRAREEGFDGASPNLYESGTVANIATFHRSIMTKDWSNPTVAASVRSNLTTILGRTAAYERREVTWDEMMAKRERWTFDLNELKA